MLFEGLSSLIANRAQNLFDKCKNNPDLLKYGITGLLPEEGLRTMPVQMAYFSRLLATQLKATESQLSFIRQYVRAMYKAAGMYTPNDSECITPITWTLESKHLKGMAFDIAATKNGVTKWWPSNKDIHLAIGLLGESCGLTWGGRWAAQGKYDPWHFEL